MLPDSVRLRIEALVASDDPLEHEVGRRLAGRLSQQPVVQIGGSLAADPAPSRWQHVEMVGLLESFGNRVSPDGDRLTSGHEPVHTSRSGTCLVVWPATGRWWCSSCHGSGDAAGYVALALGITYTAASDWLVARYGPPPTGLTRRALRRRTFTAVAG